MQRLLVCVAMGLALCAGTSLAQDRDKDKDCKVSGQITSVSADGHHFSVKDTGGKTHHVCCSKECKITFGEKKLTCKDLKVGMRVNVTGHEACHCGKHTGTDEPKACKVSGEITSVSADKHHFTVKGTGGHTHHVCCSEGCKITAGDKTVTCKDLKVGMKVRLSGHEACHCETIRVLPTGS